MMRILVLLIFISSCASYQAGNDSKNISKDNQIPKLSISAKIDNNLTTDNFTAINFYFGNLSKDWLRVKRVRLKFDKDFATKSKVVLGPDLSTWAEAISYKNSIDKYNLDMILGGLAIAGSAASLSNNSSMSKSGSVVALSSLSIGAANEVVGRLSSIRRAKLIPSTHIYSEFSVPPGLVIKRWVLLEVSYDDVPKSIEFEVELKNKKKATYSVEIRPFKNEL